MIAAMRGLYPDPSLVECLYYTEPCSTGHGYSQSQWSALHGFGTALSPVGLPEGAAPLLTGPLRGLDGEAT